MDRNAPRHAAITVSIRHPLPLVEQALGLQLQRLPLDLRLTADTGDILFAPLCMIADSDVAEGRRIVVLAERADRRMMMEARAHGAQAMIPLDLPLDQLATALTACVNGGDYWPTLAEPATLSPVSKRLGSLSGQQFKVLDLMSRGRLNKQIAYDLGISEGTVKSHVSSVLRKLGVERRTQAIAAFITTQDVMGALSAPMGAAHAAR